MPPLIDLLHPRKRIIRANYNRIYALAGAALLAGILFVGGEFYEKLNAPVFEADVAREEISSAEKIAKAAHGRRTVPKNPSALGSTKPPIC